MNTSTKRMTNDECRMTKGAARGRERALVASVLFSLGLFAIAPRADAQAPGTLDTTFDATLVGKFVVAMAVQPDGKTIIAGSFTSVLGVTRNNIARLNANGTLDTLFDPNASSVVYAVAVQPDGRVVLGGNFTSLQPNGAASATTRSHIARVNADGTLDVDFDPKANGDVYNIAVQRDGKLVLGGGFGTLKPNGAASATTRNYIARVNEDGSLDTSFDPEPNGSLGAIALQEDGKVLLAGQFTTLQPNGAASPTTRRGIARVNADGTLDPGFDPNANVAAYAMTVAADGKVLLAGSFTTLQPNGAASPTTRNHIARVNRDGTLDVGFDPNVNNAVDSIALQADGKVLLGGDFSTLQPNGAAASTTRNRIARVNRDGTLDVSFDPNANNNVYSVGIEPDGKVLIGGAFIAVQPNGAPSSTSRNFLARLNNDTAIQTLSAPDAATVRWERRGGGPAISGQVTFEQSTDVGGSYTSLGGGTRVGGTETWQLAGVSLPAGGGLLRARGRTGNGYQDGSAGIIEQVEDFGPPGSVAKSFNAKLTGSFVLGTCLQPDGKLIIAGGFSSVFGVARGNIARLNADGTLDMGFDPKTDGTVRSVVVQADGKVLLAGTFTTLQPNGAASSTARNNMARVNANGTLDTGFDPNPNSNVESLALQPDGKVVLGGDFTTLKPNGAASATARNSIARVKPDGTLDAGFNPNANNLVYTVGVQPDGKVLLGGLFNTLQPNGAPAATTRHYLARVNADGTLDTGFDPNPDSQVYCLAVQPDGEVVLGGNFLLVQPPGGVPAARTHIARVNGDGTVDYSFDPSANEPPYSIALQADGKVVLGGNFTTLQPNGAASATTRNYIARVNADGSLDTSFDPNASDIVYGVAVQPDGKVVLAGLFATVSGTARNLLARVNNDAATQSLTAPDTAHVLWVRGGGGPQIEQVTFERSTDGGGTWSPLGSGTRVGNSSNWQLANLSLPIGAYLRARGHTTSGYFAGSSSLVEEVSAYTIAPAVTTDAATNVSASGATLNAHLTSNGAVTGVTFEYSTDPALNTGVTSTMPQNFNGSASNMPVSQVISVPVHQTYYFKATATNSMTAVDGAILSFLANNAPTAPDGHATATTGDTKTVTISYPTTDADGDAVAITGATASAHLAINSFTATTLKFTPDSSYIGDATFTYTVSDGSGDANGSATGTITVTISDNDAPVLSYGSGQSVSLNGSLTVNPASGPGDNIAVQSIALQSKGSYTGDASVDNTTGVVSFSNAAPAGTHTIVVRATDSSGNTSDASFELAVQAAPTPTPTPTLTPGTTPTPTPPSQPLNISTRMEVLTDDNVLIAGFIVTGPANSTKQVMIRGLGPSLVNQGVPNPIADPLLELHSPDGSVITNDNWQDLPNVADIPDGFQPGDAREAVIIATLNVGAEGLSKFTAIVRGANGETGVGLVEAYDLTPGANQFANISTRGFVDTGDNVMIGGFILGGSDQGSKVLIRAIGASLPVSGALADPTLEIHDKQGSKIATNDNWKIDDATGESQEAAIVATTVPPPNDLESAVLATFPPGDYTAIVAGTNGGTGIGLVEVYNLK